MGRERGKKGDSMEGNGREDKPLPSQNSAISTYFYFLMHRTNLNHLNCFFPPISCLLEIFHQRDALVNQSINPCQVTKVVMTNVRSSADMD